MRVFIFEPLMMHIFKTYLFLQLDFIRTLMQKVVEINQLITPTPTLDQSHFLQLDSREMHSQEMM
ncbi:MAG: hypothetical protein EBR82_24810 [Caulobacteraceae bacterium]|nr:hypothetical protein [Caulobacteraceae bacterium]